MNIKLCVIINATKNSVSNYCIVYFSKYMKDEVKVYDKINRKIIKQFPLYLY